VPKGGPVEPDKKIVLMNKETLPQINVGETLHMARERTGQDLRYVADMLRIRYVYLEAIEKGEYQKLPGATYAIGFVRAYADHLNLNSVQIVERFKQEQDDLDQQTQLVFPKPLPEGKVPSGGILLVAVVLGVLVYGAWFFLSGQDKPIAKLIPEIPARLMALVGAGEDEDGETGPAETADADGADQVTDADEAVVAEPTEDTAAGDETADMPVVDVGADEAEADAAVSQAAPDMADEQPPVSDETAAVAEPETAPGPDETAEPVAEDTPAEAEDTDVVASDDTPATVEEPVTEPAPAAETVEAVPAAPPAEVAVEEPAVEETVAEPPTAEETTTAQTMETPAVAEPEDTAEALPTAEPEPDSDGETPVASAPAQTDTQVPAAAETAETTAADEDAAAIAQRVLEELGRTDEPAASRPLPATAGAETPAASAQQPSGEVPVAAITPAARTQDAPAADEPAAAALGNGTGPAAPSIVPVRPGGKVYGTENTQSRILITARVDSWVEVSTQQGELLLTRVLRAGDSFKVPDQEGLSLVTGNAGGLAISVDGAQVPDLGPVGAVRRGVELDPDRLKAGTARNL